MCTHLGLILAITVTACAVAALITGAHLTSTHSMSGMLHRGLSTAASVSTIVLAFRVTGPIRYWLIGSVVLAAVPGGLLEAKIAPGVAGLAHAVAASILMSVCAVAALQLSWQGEAATIVDEGSPSLKALARATWIGLLIQTALGAMYRHQIVGLLPHVAGAMLVMGMVMYAAISAFSTEHAPPAVKRPALILMILTGVQMLIGLGAYLYRVEFREQATGQAAMLTFTVTHVAVGALTTACSAVMGMQISRYVRPAVVAS